MYSITRLLVKDIKEERIFVMSKICLWCLEFKAILSHIVAVDEHGGQYLKKTIWFYTIYTSRMNRFVKQTLIYIFKTLQIKKKKFFFNNYVLLQIMYTIYTPYSQISTLSKAGASDP